MMFKQPLRGLQLFITTCLLLLSAPLWAAWELNMPRGASVVSQDIYDLHMTMFYWCVGIGVVVFGVMFWSILMHRKSRGAKPAEFHENTLIEIIWTAVPFGILIAMAIPATQTLRTLYDKDNADLDIQVTGYQWKWKYDYIGQDVSYFSVLNTPKEEIDNELPKGEHYLLEVDEPLVVPIQKKIRFLITSNDVIHAWWVPDLAIKRDAIPGFIRESWTRIEKPGIYRGQCAELCGKDHGFMPIVVVAKEQAEYDQWLADKKAAQAKERELTEKVWTQAELSARGEKVYNTACAACHQGNGEGVSGIFPALKGSKIVTEDQLAHINIVYNGKLGTAMAAFGAQLNEADLAAVITYERNAWGNNTGDVIQPRDILEFKKAQSK